MKILFSRHWSDGEICEPRDTEKTKPENPQLEKPKRTDKPKPEKPKKNTDINITKSTLEIEGNYS